MRYLTRLLVILLLVSGVLLTASAGALAGSQTVEMTIPDLGCASTVAIVSSILQGFKGVEKVDIPTYDPPIATVTFDDEQTSADEIKSTLQKKGYYTSDIKVVE